MYIVKSGIVQKRTALLLVSTCSVFYSLSGYSAAGENIEEVVVTAAGFEQQLINAPASISVITSEELEARAYTNILDAMRNVPGVSITSSSEGEDISLRGMPASYTLILIDGKPVSTRESRPNGSAGYEQDWLPPLNTVERIEVVRGPMSTRYGSNAMGGVINIITRKVPQEWGGSLTYESTIQESSRSGDIGKLDFSASGALVDETVGLMIFGQTYKKDEDQFIGGSSQKELDSLNARLSITALDDHSFTLETNYQDQKRYGHMGVSQPSEGCRGGCTDSEQWHTSRTFSASHAGNWGIATSDTFVQVETTKNHGRDIEISNSVLKTSWVMPLNDHVVTAGADFLKEELNDQTTNRISDRTHIDNAQKAFFIEDSWSLSEPFSLTFGARVNDAQHTDINISPRLYGVWNLSDRWTLKGGVSTGFVAPGLREITPDWGQTSRGGNVYGNPDLQAETSVNTEVGLHFLSRGSMSANVTLFQNDFNDKITRVACPVAICPDGPNSFGSLPTYRINVDEAETRGVEFSLDATIAESLDLALSYTFNDSEQKSGDNAGQPLSQLPRHQVSVNLDHYASNGLRSWVQANYRGEESEPTSLSDDFIAPGYAMIDTGFSYPLRESVQLKFGIYNLLDKRITEEEFGRTEDGRRYWVAVNLEF